jgi:hypothetical protein
MHLEGGYRPRGTRRRVLAAVHTLQERGTERAPPVYAGRSWLRRARRSERVRYLVLALIGAVLWLLLVWAMLAVKEALL